MSAPTRKPATAARRATPDRAARKAPQPTSGTARTQREAIGYVRVSTERQAERYGPAAQRAALRAWSKETGIRIVRIVEEATSGALSEREGLGEVLAEIREGKASGVVVARLDRFSRDLLVQEHLMSDVWSMGGEVYSAARDENNLRDDPDDPSRKLIRRMLGAVVEYDREMTLLRLRNGRKAKAKAGGFAYGSPPLGYRAVNGALVPEPTEQKTLRLLLKLSRAGESTRAVADALNAAGHTTKRGRPWTSSGVSDVLRRPVTPPSSHTRSTR